MKNCCKNCRFNKVGISYSHCSGLMPCYNLVPYPEAGCSHFKCKDSCLYAIIYRNSETGKSDVLNIFDDIRLAKSELQNLSETICKHPSSHINFYIEPYLFEDACVIADDILMSIVNTVAQDLLIAERGFKKGFFKKETFEKSKKWFDFAYSACRRGGAILDVVLND